MLESPSAVVDGDIATVKSWCLEVQFWMWGCSNWEAW
jgi:hypothetical protein